MELIEKLIQKYLNGNISPEELSSLSEWMKGDKNNQRYLKDRIKDNYLIDLWRLDHNKQSPVVIPAQHRSYGRRRWSSDILKYAAILLVVLISAMGIRKLQNKGSLDYKPLPVTLKMGDGSLKVLQEDDSSIITDAEGNKLGNHQKNQLDYTADHDTTAAMATTYNELTVPEGRRFNVVLSDGTLVFLNSGSTFKFPVSFSNKGERQVFLEGEGYFSVTRDEKHPFIVNTEDIAVRVLGTKFNVRAYQNDSQVKTTLVKGSVNVRSNQFPENQVMISPGEAAFFTEADQTMTVDKVILGNDVAWIDNRLLFIDEPFSEIQKKIERSYGVKIVNQNKKLNDVHFFGDFDIQQEGVEDVLDAFSTIEFFKYSLHKNTVTIKD